MTRRGIAHVGHQLSANAFTLDLSSVIRVSPLKWFLHTYANNRAYLVFKTNVLSDSTLRPWTELLINLCVEYDHLLTNIL